MDSIKQTPPQNLQEELDSHMETMNGQIRAHHQQALSLHKVDMEASVMEVSPSSQTSEEGCCFQQMVTTVWVIPYYKSDVTRWGDPSWPVDTVDLRSTVVTAAVILTVKSAQSVPPVSS